MGAETIFLIVFFVVFVVIFIAALYVFPELMGISRSKDEPGKNPGDDSKPDGQ